ncbi:MAG: hypothetical protein GY910_27235 [bacterium]|nr:hypothetical protein [bacterium]
MEARLDPPEIATTDLTFRAAGLDPDAPRILILWRFEEGAYRRLASVRSDRTGRFNFGAWPIPLREGSFHVMPEEHSPEGSRPVRVVLPVPSPAILSSGFDPGEIEIAPALFEGEIQLRDEGSGRLLLRRTIDPTVRGNCVIDFEATGLASQTDLVSIEHVLPDGRRSRPVLWPLSVR